MCGVLVETKIKSCNTDLLSCGDDHRLLTIPVLTGGGVGVVEVDPRPDRKVDVSRHNIFSLAFNL